MELLSLPSLSTCCSTLWSRLFQYFVSHHGVSGEKLEEQENKREK